MDEQTAKTLQTQLEKEISDWSLQRYHLERRLKHMKTRMIVIGSLIFVLEIIHMFVTQLVFPPYNAIVTLALSVWFIVLVVRYSLGYKDKICTRSADRIIKLAADYNEAIKDVPNARHCDFLPPEIYQQKKQKRFATKKRARVAVATAATASVVVAQTAVSQAANTTASVAPVADQAAA